jgi:CBS domain-containing protein
MEDIYAGRIMSVPPLTATPSESIETAAQTMLENGIGSLVVVDENKALQGILTGTDCIELIAGSGDTEEAVVGDYMTTDVTTVTATQDVRDIADKLITKDIHHAPVVDENEVVLGIVTTTDITAYLSHVQRPSPQSD